MRKRLLMEDYHLSILVPGGLAPGTHATIYRILEDVHPRCVAPGRAHSVIRRYSALHSVRLRLSR
jgi:hypothetical protein